MNPIQIFRDLIKIQSKIVCLKKYIFWETFPNMTWVYTYSRFNVFLFKIPRRNTKLNIKCISNNINIFFKYFDLSFTPSLVVWMQEVKCSVCESPSPPPPSHPIPQPPFLLSQHLSPYNELVIKSHCEPTICQPLENWKHR